MPLAEELETLIDSSTTERSIVRWLKQKENAWILPLAVRMFPVGKPAERFAGALAQVRDWKIYVDKNRDIVLKELAKSAEKEALLWTQRTKNSKFPSSFSPLRHPRAGFNWDYHIVIGRRTSLSQEQLEKKAAFHNTDSVEVMTYDRLIDAAKAWDTDKGKDVEFRTPWRNQREGLCSEDLYLHTDVYSQIYNMQF